MGVAVEPGPAALYGAGASRGTAADERLFKGLRDDKAAQAGGVVRDVLLAGALSVECSLHLARVGLHAAFSLSQRVVCAQAAASSRLGLESLARALAAVENGLGGGSDAAQRLVQRLQAAALSSLGALDAPLAARYARGDVIRLLFRDSHTREALLCVLKLLEQLGTLMPGRRDPVRLLSGMGRLAAAQASHKVERVRTLRDELASSLSCVPVHAGATLRRWQRLLRLSLAAYGPLALRVMQLASTDSVAKAAAALAPGVTEDDVVLCGGGGGEMYSPAHFVALDREHSAVTVAIRGSMCLSDVLVDLVCESVPFAVPLEPECQHGAGPVPLLEGKAHRGFLIAAHRLAQQLEPVVLEQLRRNPGFALVVTGHSLGAGVATLLALLWAQAPALAHVELIRAVVFGAPCSLCHQLSQAPFTRRIVTSFVLGDDFVARLSFGTVAELQRGIVTLAHWEDQEGDSAWSATDVQADPTDCPAKAEPEANPAEAVAFTSAAAPVTSMSTSMYTSTYSTSSAEAPQQAADAECSVARGAARTAQATAAWEATAPSDADLAQAYTRMVPRDPLESKLFSAGEVWLLDAPEFNGHAVQVDPLALLHSLEVSASALTLHLPTAYLAAIDALPCEPTDTPAAGSECAQC
jgi:hypothetical protein